MKEKCKFTKPQNRRVTQALARAKAKMQKGSRADPENYIVRFRSGTKGDCQDLVL